MNPEERKYARVAIIISIIAIIISIILGSSGWIALFPGGQFIVFPVVTSTSIPPSSTPTALPSVLPTNTEASVTPATVDLAPSAVIEPTSQPTSIPQIPTPRPTRIQPTSTTANLPLATATTSAGLVFKWSVWSTCATDSDVVEIRVHNLNQVEVQVIGQIKAKPDGGQEVTLAEVPPQYQNCGPGLWCGPGERIRNRYPGGFQGFVSGITSVYYLGREVDSKPLGPVHLTCPG